MNLQMTRVPIRRRRPDEVQAGDLLVCTHIVKCIADNYLLDWRVLASWNGPNSIAGKASCLLQRITYYLIDLGPTAIGILYKKGHSTVLHNLDKTFDSHERTMVTQCLSRLNLKVPGPLESLSLQRSPLLVRFSLDGSWSELLVRQSEGIYALPDLTPGQLRQLGRLGVHLGTSGSLIPYKRSTPSGTPLGTIFDKNRFDS